VSIELGAKDATGDRDGDVELDADTEGAGRLPTSFEGSLLSRSIPPIATTATAATLTSANA